MTITAGRGGEYRNPTVSNAARVSVNQRVQTAVTAIDQHRRASPAEVGLTFGSIAKENLKIAGRLSGCGVGFISESIDHYKEAKSKYNEQPSRARAATVAGKASVIVAATALAPIITAMVAPSVPAMLTVALLDAGTQSAIGYTLDGFDQTHPDRVLTREMRLGNRT